MAATLIIVELSQYYADARNHYQVVTYKTMEN